VCCVLCPTLSSLIARTTLTYLTLHSPPCCGQMEGVRIFSAEELAAGSSLDDKKKVTHEQSPHSLRSPCSLSIVSLSLRICI
jgi:hypothetical protein